MLVPFENVRQDTRITITNSIPDAISDHRRHEDCDKCSCAPISPIHPKRCVQCTTDAEPSSTTTVHASQQLTGALGSMASPSRFNSDFMQAAKCRLIGLIAPVLAAVDVDAHQAKQTSRNMTSSNSNHTRRTMLKITVSEGLQSSHWVVDTGVVRIRSENLELVYHD